MCAIPTPDGRVCGHCLANPPAFAATIAGFSYDFPVDSLIQALKYGGNLAVASLLARLLAEQVAPESRPDLVIPMPLHPARLGERGFNQSTEIARPLARSLKLTLASDICRRAKNTPPQATLDHKERVRNIRGAFSSAGEVAGKKLAVVDDVMTSGATVNELAKTLLRAGAAEVRVWVVARALPAR